MLPYSRRLRLQGDFNRVYRRGKAERYAWFVLYRCRRGPGPARVGFSVSKKVGKAVQRNLIKRRFRHAVAPLLDQLPGGFDYIFVVRPSAMEASYDRLSAQIRRSLLEPKPAAGKQ